MDMASFLHGDNWRIRQLQSWQQALARTHDYRLAFISLGRLFNII
jgi:hypothetical protein